MAQPIAQLRRTLLVALLACTIAIGLVAQAPRAAAEEGYRYWAYYQWTGNAWAYAQKAADGIVPADGSIEGWRYAQATSAAPRTPRAAGDFAAICAEVPPDEGKKRVAVVIDQGTAEDAPTTNDKPNGQVRGTCVMTDPEANGAQILAAVTDVRKEKLTCGIGGYPADGCGGAVQIQAATSDAPLPLTVQPPVVPQAFQKGRSAQTGTGADAQGRSGGGSGPIIAGVAIVLVLAAGGYLLTRRNRDRQA